MISSTVLSVIASFCVRIVISARRLRVYAVPKLERACFRRVLISYTLGIPKMLGQHRPQNTPAMADMRKNGGLSVADLELECHSKAA